MCRYLPWKDIRFCTKAELEELRVELGIHKGVHLSETASVGYALEVTLRYPEDRKDSFWEYPLFRYMMILQCSIGTCLGSRLTPPLSFLEQRATHC